MLRRAVHVKGEPARHPHTQVIGREQCTRPPHPPEVADEQLAGLHPVGHDLQVLVPQVLHTGGGLTAHTGRVVGRVGLGAARLQCIGLGAAQAARASASSSWRRRRLEAVTALLNTCIPPKPPRAPELGHHGVGGLGQFAVGVGCGKVKAPRLLCLGGGDLQHPAQGWRLWAVAC